LDELLGGDFSSGHAGYDGVRSSTLHVGQGAVVRVQEGIASAIKDDFVVDGGKDGSYGRLAVFASILSKESMREGKGMSKWIPTHMMGNR